VKQNKWNRLLLPSQLLPMQLHLGQRLSTSSSSSLSLSLCQIRYTPQRLCRKSASLKFSSTPTWHVVKLMKKLYGYLDGVLAGPFSCRVFVTRAVWLVDVCDFRDERIIRIRVCEHGANGEQDCVRLLVDNIQQCRIGPKKIITHLLRLSMLGSTDLSEYPSRCFR
jgi:hypothetical protein